MLQWSPSPPETAASVPAGMPAGPAARLADAYAETASAGSRARSKQVAARTNEIAVDVPIAPSPEEPRAQAAAARVAPTRAQPAAPSGPTTAREACGDRRFIALAICIDRECERPRFREGAECVRVLEVKRRRAER